MDASSGFIIGVLVGLFLGLLYTHISIGALKRELAKLVKKEDNDEQDDPYWWKKGKRPPHD